MKVISIQSFLESYRNELKLSIQNTECYKWTRWQKNNNIHVFPCVCPVRNKECIFIEIYFEVQKTYRLILKKQEYTYALEEYYKIRHNRNAVFEWVKFYEPLGKEVEFFSPEIKVHTRVEPYKATTIYLPLEQFPNLLKFQKIFTGYYHSEEYENH